MGPSVPGSRAFADKLLSTCSMQFKVTHFAEVLFVQHEACHLHYGTVKPEYFDCQKYWCKAIANFTDVFKATLTRTRPCVCVYVTMLVM
jgi:hypothetical protein